MSAQAEVKWNAVVAVAGQVNAEGNTYTEEELRRAGDGRMGELYRYDEASKSLIYHGSYTEGDWGRAVYTFCLPRKPNENQSTS